jgi:hypothetical protein
LKPERSDGVGGAPARVAGLTVLGERLSICPPLPTFDTDYVLVREEQLDLAIDTLQVRGHRVGDHAAGGR